MAKEKKISRKIDMVEHDLRLKSIGLSERVKKFVLRVFFILIPVILIIYWFSKIK